MSSLLVRPAVAVIPLLIPVIVVGLSYILYGDSTTPQQNEAQASQSTTASKSKSTEEALESDIKMLEQLEARLAHLKRQAEHRDNMNRGLRMQAIELEQQVICARRDAAELEREVQRLKTKKWF